MPVVPLSREKRFRKSCSAWRVDELAERLVDQGDVGFAEQMVDVLRRPKDDPVKRQLKQIGARLHAAVALAARLGGKLRLAFLYDLHRPPGYAIRLITITAYSLGAREKLRVLNA